MSRDAFLKSEENAILDASDTEAGNFAKEYFGYERAKGLDLVARFNGKYVLGEAKFLTEFGGHQNTQFDDAIKTMDAIGDRAVPVAILDGVLYIKSNYKIHKEIMEKHKNRNIMSALVLREFLYQL